MNHFVLPEEPVQTVAVVTKDIFGLPDAELLLRRGDVVRQVVQRLEGASGDGRIENTTVIGNSERGECGR